MVDNSNVSPEDGGNHFPEKQSWGAGSLAHDESEASRTLPGPDAITVGTEVRSAEWLERGWAFLDASGKVTAIGDELAEWFEKLPSDLLGQGFWEELSDRDNGWIAALAHCRESKEAFLETRLRCSSGNGRGARWYSMEISQVNEVRVVRLSSILPPLAELEEGTWDENLGSTSAQRQLFVRLLRAESQLQNLTDRWPGVIFSQRSDLSFRFVSSKIEEITGVPVADWSVRPQLLWEIVDEADREDLRQQIRSARQLGQTVTCTYRIRHIHSGRITFVLEHRRANVSRGGLLLGYEGMWLDVTRQTIAENRLTGAAWKETLSVLTMGLAHDFSNVMAGIHALSEAFQDPSDATNDSGAGLALIRKNAEQASLLVHRIINLHQGKTGDRNHYNLNELASEFAELIRRVIPRRMHFSVELASEPLPVYLDAVELRQVVLNLVLNALDAMPQAGRLVLRTAGFHELPTFDSCQGQSPRTPAACLSLQDTGCGIKLSHRDSIFDPFFTTKPANKGSGLGLYNARAFVDRHRGAITVDSTEGVGSTFHIWLPQADFSEAEMEGHGLKVGPAEDARRTLLLTGGSRDAISGTAEILQVGGYATVTVTPAAAVLGSLNSPDHHFRGLVLVADPIDRELLALVPAIRRSHPRLKIFLRAAVSDTGLFAAEIKRDVDAFIPLDLPQERVLENFSKSF